MARRREQSVIRVVAPDGSPLAATGYLFYADADGEDGVVELEQAGTGALAYALDRNEQPQAAVVVPQSPGFWTTRSELCWDGQTVLCEDLGQTTSPSWWHALLGDHIDDAGRGDGIRIGVVDSGFSPMDGLNHVVRVDVDEGPPMVFLSRGFWRHGEIVCRIIGDSGAPDAASAIAPGAQLFFSNASFARATVQDALFQFPADDGSPEDDLDPRLVNRAIDALSAEHGVDIINLSLGSFGIGWEETGLAEAIRAARARGAIVIAAAGNEPQDAAAFPAILDECVGVGAYGSVGWGSEESVSRYFSDLADRVGEIDGMELFYHPESAWGDGVDVLGPGVGIVTSRSGRLAFDVTGTSFAAPVVSGLLAVALAGDEIYLALPRDETRTRHAEWVLGELCRDGGFAFSTGHKVVSF